MEKNKWSYAQRINEKVNYNIIKKINKLYN